MIHLLYHIHGSKSEAVQRITFHVRIVLENFATSIDHSSVDERITLKVKCILANLDGSFRSLQLKR